MPCYGGDKLLNYRGGRVGPRNPPDFVLGGRTTPRRRAAALLLCCVGVGFKLKLRQSSSTFLPYLILKQFWLIGALFTIEFQIHIYYKHCVYILTLFDLHRA